MAALPGPSFHRAGVLRSRLKPRVLSMLVRILYWLAVLAVSTALVFGLLLFFESRDDSSIGGVAVPDTRTALGPERPYG